MTTLLEAFPERHPVEDHRPWPRLVVDEAEWRRTAQRCADGDWTLFGLWGDADSVHMAVLDATTALAVLTLPCAHGRFPSVGRIHAPAIRLERAIGDLFGLEAVGAPDDRGWLDHGRWPCRHPLGDRAAAGAAIPYRFLPVEGESLHQIPVGPVHAGIIEPGHFRFTANGETVVRLEERLGYVHKGIEGLLAGADLGRAARLACRTSGDSAVAYAVAFARAAEAALGVAVPERALWLRALMAELERIAHHVGDIGAICNDASFSLMHAHCAVLRERVLRGSAGAFGHRLMMDAVLPGGVATDLTDDAAGELRALAVELAEPFENLVRLYDNTPTLMERTVTTGRLDADLARRFGAGGFVGRASGRAFDARRALPAIPYDRLSFDVPVRTEGDVNARVWLRILEVRQSLALIGQILDRLPGGPVCATLPLHGGEGMGVAEGFRGDVLAWLRLDEDGRIARCHLRDPSWFQWPLLEAVIEGNIVADFPICNKSFNCSYSGHDL